jgi:CheY-like chemotaxis protein
VIGLAPGQRAYRILVAEDKWESRQLLVKLLTSVGFQVREAENGEEAVALWSSWQPHLIWMDMRMPVMDGYEATKRIKSQLKGQTTVIIALTASAFEEQRAAILSVGCDDFMRKPFREDVLFSKMAEHLGVRYIYEKLEQPELSLPRGGEGLKPESLTLMSDEWRVQLYRAAEACNDEEILSLIEQIPGEHRALKLALADLVDNFRFDVILDLSEALIHE